jgi:hypothetical protein
MRPMAQKPKTRSRRELLKHLEAFQSRFATLKHRVWTDNREEFRKNAEDGDVQLRNTWKALNELAIACTCVCYEFNAWMFGSQRGIQVRAVDDSLRALSSHLSFPEYQLYQREWEDIDNWWSSLYVELEAYCISKRIGIPGTAHAKDGESTHTQFQDHGSGTTHPSDAQTSDERSSRSSVRLQQDLDSQELHTRQSVSGLLL